MPLNPFHILHLSSYGSLKGGGQESLFQLVTNLDKGVFQSRVAVPTEGNFARKLDDHGIEVAVLELPKIVNVGIHRNCRALYGLLRMSSRYHVDLIHTDGPRNTFYAGLVAKIRRIPLIWHVRASNRDRYDRLLYRLSSRIILVANALRSRFDWIAESQRFVTIYNGVDLSGFGGTASLISIREQYGISRKSLVIATIGRVERPKGQRDLIEACGRLRDRLPDFHILVVGEMVELPYLAECKDSARGFGIQDRVIFTGYHEEVVQVLRETDIFVLPSHLEAFPRSVIEAMGAGKPVIVTDVGGCPEAVEDQISGFVVPARDSEALAGRIHALAVDHELRLRIGRNARMRAEGMFGIEHNVRQTERVYLEALKGNAYNIK